MAPELPIKGLLLPEETHQVAVRTAVPKLGSTPGSPRVLSKVSGATDAPRQIKSDLWGWGPALLFKALQVIPKYRPG